MKINDYAIRKFRRKHFLKQFEFKRWKKAAGRISFCFSIPFKFLEGGPSDKNTIDVLHGGIHMFPYRKHILFGYSEDWYDGPIYYLGLGPLCLLVWQTFPKQEGVDE